MMRSVIWDNMDLVKAKKAKYNVDKIYMDLELLKKRINYYVYHEEDMKAEELKSNGINKLARKRRRLSVQYEKLKKDLLFYESIYEKALMKQVKNLRRKITEGKIKLEDLKEKCKHLDGQMHKIARKWASMRRDEKTDKHLEEKNLLINGENKMKLKSNTESDGWKMTSISKRKCPRINGKIKIKIQRNKKSGVSKMFFINDGKTQRSFCDLMKKKEKKPLHLQECRIMLQKLTEEETKLYTNGKHLVEQPRKNQYISQQSLSQSSESRSVNSKPTWRIRIPKSVLNESQNEIDNSNSNESSNPMHIMRTRTSYR